MRSRRRTRLPAFLAMFFGAAGLLMLAWCGEAAWRDRSFATASVVDGVVVDMIRRCGGPWRTGRCGLAPVVQYRRLAEHGGDIRRFDAVTYRGSDARRNMRVAVAYRPDADGAAWVPAWPAFEVGDLWVALLLLGAAAISWLAERSRRGR